MAQHFFLIYINDNADSIDSKIKIFADDTKIYREIKIPETDSQALQKSLHSLCNWAQKWQLSFNADESETMRITHSRDKITLNYSYMSKALKNVQSIKDLGVTISRGLSWSKHVGITENKANRVLGIIRRTIGTANKKVFITL